MSTPVSQVVKPSCARRLVLDGFIPRPRGSMNAVPPILSWGPKDPQDVLDYEFDIGSALTGNPNDVISSVNITVSPQNPGDLIVNSVATDGSTIILWLAAGQAGTTYAVTLLITMVSGRTIQRTPLLPVIPLSTTTPPADAIVTDTGVVITDQYRQSRANLLITDCAISIDDFASGPLFGALTGHADNR